MICGECTNGSGEALLVLLTVLPHLVEPCEDMILRHDSFSWDSEPIKGGWDGIATEKMPQHTIILLP